MHEVPEVSAEVINSAFLNKIDSGFRKEAEEAGSAYIRRKLYEDGITRRLFDFRTVTPDELDPTEDPEYKDKPSIVCELEPDAPKATYVGYKGTGDRRYFTNMRYRIVFGKVESERISKSKFELMTIRMPIMDWFKEHQVKMVQQEEDGYFVDTLRQIIKDANGKQSEDAPKNESFKDSFTRGLKGLTRARLPIGKVLMHKNTYLDSLKLKTDEIGFKPQEKRFESGIEDEDSFMGYKVVTTIKSDIIKENELFFFTDQMFFGKFYFLQDATLFIKTEADMYNFHTYEAPGIGIGNTLGVYLVNLQP